MKVQVQTRLENARYFVTVSLRDFEKVDIEKMQKFGTPLVSIYPKEALYNNTWTGELPLYDFYVTFDFESPDEADEYIVMLKERIKEAMEYLRSLEDTFSRKEVSEF